MLQIDGTVFVHGGLPPLVAQLGLERVNGQLRRDLAEFVTLWHALRDEGLIPFDQAADLAAVELAKLLESKTPPALGEAARQRIVRFVELSESPVFSDSGPLWYRGSARCHPLLETDVIDASLSRLGARRVVVGHTPTRNRRAATRLGERVFMIDSGMLASFYSGTPVALVIEQGGENVVYPELPAVSEAIRVDHDNAADWAGDIEDLERFLRETAIVAREENKRKEPTIVTLRSADGRQAQATVMRQREAQRELAAYRLDRLLGIGIVPVTVLRDIDGRESALQLRPPDWIDEPTRIERGLALPARCARGDNFELMFVFDALTANNRSNAATILHSRDRERLWITGFGPAFSARLDLPRYLAATADTLAIPGEIARRLRALDAARLERELGDALNKRERRALLRRRDVILADWTIR